jgi:hypothetical protein
MSDAADPRKYPWTHAWKSQQAFIWDFGHFANIQTAAIKFLQERSLHQRR